ncbi:unnamed protein product [Thlaspi arvense]|uniref:NAC domain-containing protein n=1 Tax=Thlaspi arvense TaxID=13288 RepID=A0AAU9RLJ9_THLAR|nr:unnamed protein product [Thlaspi arvense]
MMGVDQESSSVPPGFRFHPTDEELVGYYLKKKVASQRIDLDVIREIDLYKIEPWDLQERCRIGYEEQKEWYFFSHKDKKYPTGTRTNRATMAGFWKATGRDKAVYLNSKLIGMRKTLVFYRGRAPNGQKSDWIIHEYYSLESHQNAPPQEEGWVVCRAFKKRTTVPAKRRQLWDPNCFFYDATLLEVEPIDKNVHIKRTKHNTDFVVTPFKQELLSEANHIVQDGDLGSMYLYSIDDNQFSQLPQLESPSLPSDKLPEMAPHSNISEISRPGEDEASAAVEKKITDWRSLDKLLACKCPKRQKEEDVSLLKNPLLNCPAFVNHMGASDSTLLGAQENRGGDVITTISHRSEIVDPVLEKLKSLTVSRPLLKSPPTESSLTDILVRKALSSSSSNLSFFPDTVDPQILVELFSIYREWQESKSQEITKRQEDIENKIEVADALATKLVQRFNHSVSAMRTTSQHLSQVHGLQVELGELKGRLTEVINNCDTLCKRINSEGPESLRSTVRPFALAPLDSVSINTTLSSKQEA